MKCWFSRLMILVAGRATRMPPHTDWRGRPRCERSAGAVALAEGAMDVDGTIHPRRSLAADSVGPR
jgi:hypothetical protein